MTSQSRAIHVFLGAIFFTSAPLMSQVPAPPPEPYRPQRFLVVGNVAFEGQWKPLTTIGGLWQISLQKTRIGRDELGVTHISPPRWYLHTLLSAGAWFDPPESSKSAVLTAFGELGAVKRIDSPMTAWGGTINASSSPRSIGSAFRVEIMDNIGLQLGLTRIRGSTRTRLFISVDYFKKLCEDLGFGMAC